MRCALGPTLRHLQRNTGALCPPLQLLRCPETQHRPGEPCIYTHLRTITASPGSRCGLPSRGLRGVRLEQEELREDWLLVWVLAEPCGYKNQRSKAVVPSILLMGPHGS